MFWGGVGCVYCVVCGCIVGAMFAVVSVTSVVDVSVEVSVTDSVS